MNEQNNFFTELGQVVDRYRAKRRSIYAEQSTEPQRSNFLRRLAHWLMPNGGTLLLIAVLILTQRVWAKPLLAPSAAPGPSATTVNYQGRLADNGGTPLTGAYGMTFALYDAATGGNLKWGPESHAAVPVSDGLFSVGLGSQTGGGIPTNVWDGDRYLEITVGGETLSPRELIRSVPIAGMALTVPDGAIGSRQMAPSWYEDYNTSTISTTSTDPVSTDVSVTFTCDTACTALILHRGVVSHSAQDGRVDVSIWVDGNKAFRELGVPNVAYEVSTLQRWHQVSGFDFVNLSAGSHSVEVKFKCYTGTCYYGSWSEHNWEHLNVLVFAQP